MASIRERNILFHNAIVDILGLADGKDWLEVRREISDDQVREIHTVYGALWPPETDIFGLLPKPDGSARAIYSGTLHPRLAGEFLAAAPLYFGDVLFQSPFTNPRTVKSEFSPVENPNVYKSETIKNVFLFLHLFPLIEHGSLSMLPDPCDFNYHLRDQMMNMAEGRISRDSINLDDDLRHQWLMQEEFIQSLYAAPDSHTRNKIHEINPSLSDEQVEQVLLVYKQMKEEDPLVVLQDDLISGGEGGGQFMVFHLSPNFEMGLLLAQATGAFIITDSRFRWSEILKECRQLGAKKVSIFPNLEREIFRYDHKFLHDTEIVLEMLRSNKLSGYRNFVRSLLKEIASTNARDIKGKIEQRTIQTFRRAHGSAEKDIVGSKADTLAAKIQFTAPEGGVVHNNAQRMLLTNGVDVHTDFVPAAFFIERKDLSWYNTKSFLRPLM